MKKLIVLGIVAALLLSADTAMAANTNEIGYNAYASSQLTNQRGTFSLVGNVSTALFGGSNAYSNAKYFGMYSINNSFAGANGTEDRAILFGAIATDSASQTNLNAGFQALGLNASNVTCGKLDANGTLQGDCHANAGTHGTSAESRARRNVMVANFGGATAESTLQAQGMTTLLKGLMSAYITVQKGQVADLESAGEVVS